MRKRGRLMTERPAMDGETGTDQSDFNSRHGWHGPAESEALYPLARFVHGRINRLLPALALCSCFAAPPNPTLADTVSGPEGEIEITAITHNGAQLAHGDLVVTVDPWSIMGLDGLQTADLILVTDNPSHHLDPEAIAALSDDDTVVVIPANSSQRLPHGMVLANGEEATIAGVRIEAIAAYDIIPGAPEHPKGDANGYVVTLAGLRFFFAGVTECVDEVKAVRDIDVAFMPMNIPVGRMTPPAAAECTRLLDPDVVYLYHYDQGYARRAANPDTEAGGLIDGMTINETLAAFERELAGSEIEVRRGDFYPPLP